MFHTTNTLHPIGPGFRLYWRGIPIYRKRTPDTQGHIFDIYGDPWRAKDIDASQVQAGGQRRERPATHALGVRGCGMSEAG